MSYDRRSQFQRSPPRTRDTEIATRTGDWITDSLVEETLSVWSPYYDGALNKAEAVEIVRTVGRLIQLTKETNDE
jgi:hypothetical protein